MNAPTLISRTMSEEPDMAALAARLLRSPEALPNLNAADARTVVAYMRLLRCPEGQVLTRENEAAGNGVMLLVLDGEVTVENLVVPQRLESRVVSVLGPGHLLGETSLLDGGERTATCIATTPVIGAGLSRNALSRLRGVDPEIAAKVVLGVGVRVAQRLRDATRQQRVYQQLLNAMQSEVDALQRQLQQVMDGALARSGRHEGGSGRR